MVSGSRVTGWISTLYLYESFHESRDWVTNWSSPSTILSGFCTTIGPLADQTDDSVLFVWPLEIWLAMNFIAIKSKPYNFLFLHRLTSKPCHDTHICFICRNLDSRTKMLEDHASQCTYNSRIMTVFHEFFRFKLFLAVNSRITRNPCKNDQWCQCLSPK